MTTNSFPMRIRRTARSAELKEEIISSFKRDGVAARQSFAKFDEADWTSVMWWLDMSGMAIYFLDRAQGIGADHAVPHDVIENLAHRLENNRHRTQSLLQESIALAGAFENAGIHYALLKGITLAPESVPESVLRCQTDLDFLVLSGDVKAATDCIEQKGYKHFLTRSNTMEFRAGAPNKPDLSNLYSALTQRALELHWLSASPSEPNLLTRRVPRSFNGSSIYALSPADILVKQATHLLKHLCGEHTRLSWILEFWRHVSARRSDERFWSEVQVRVKETTNGDLAMGIAFWLASEFFGDTGAGVPEEWRSDALPVRIRLWLERYARQLLTSDLLGNKLYALLRREVPCSPQEARKTRDILLPRVLPFRILEPQPAESVVERLDRYAIELKFFLRRLGFHIRENVRLVFESARWNRATAKVER